MGLSHFTNLIGVNVSISQCPLHKYILKNIRVQFLEMAAPARNSAVVAPSKPSRRIVSGMRRKCVQRNESTGCVQKIGAPLYVIQRFEEKTTSKIIHTGSEASNLQMLSLRTLRHWSCRCPTHYEKRRGQRIIHFATGICQLQQHVRNRMEVGMIEVRT